MKSINLKQNTLKLMQFHYIQVTFQKAFQWVIWTRLNGYAYNFSVNYDAIAVDDISDIHKYLMKKNDINNVWILLKNVYCNNRFYWI